ncbi:hypothetical protein FDO65_04370 [Nakamurella flava]|uniref:Uncharacterized protein n=1 Tax=Nakamurella flava TaxID=2576308 RepID=A0A4U6QKB2_9ACTN|nr:hypothetical protein [Nakamurella flava]TKV60904.1 hypothetical protein FDO65_04370 [Nakamurella flava]
MTSADPTPGALDGGSVRGLDGGPVAPRLRSFLDAHGGVGTAVVSSVGRRGARIVVVAESDGAWADAVVASVPDAVAVCSAAGITVADHWTRELSGRVTVSDADRRRMAGTGR